MADAPWPKPPREPGPWAGGLPVAPPGNTPLPPLPGPGGVTHGTAGSNPWASPVVPPPPPPFAGRSQPGPGAPPFPGSFPGSAPLVDRAPRWIVALAVVVVLAVIGGAAFVVVDGGKDYPSEWDPRVAPIAAWVAETRGLEFEHPVEVQFLTAEEYTKATTGGDDVESDPEEDQALDDYLAMLRALGMVSGDVDLGEASDTLADSGSLAYYQPATETVIVRGSELTPGLRVTLAHELTHVLQDQHFDLERLGDLTEGESTVLRAMAEGDATRIEERYKADVLSAEERTAADAEGADDGAMDEIESKVPPAMTAFFASPYIFGPELVTYLERSGGAERIDEALADPPTEEVLFDPLVYGTPAAEDRDVTVDAPEGSEAIDDGDFGPTTWYLMLASRLDPHVALRATDGLDGDAYVVYREGDRVCVQAHAGGDEDTDVMELSDALTQWIAQSPADTASVEVVDGEVRFRSCDPGADAPAVGSASVDLLTLPVARTQVYNATIAEGATDAQSRCYAQGLVDALSIEQLTSDVAGPELEAVFAEQQARCI